MSLKKLKSVHICATQRAGLNYFIMTFDTSVHWCMWSTLVAALHAVMTRDEHKISLHSTTLRLGRSSLRKSHAVSATTFAYLRCCNCTPLACSGESCTASRTVSSADLYALHTRIILVPNNAAVRRMLIRRCNSCSRSWDSDRAGRWL